MITVAAPLSFDARSVYQLVVVASSGGGGGGGGSGSGSSGSGSSSSGGSGSGGRLQTAEGQVIVTVIDVNNAPTFVDVALLPPAPALADAAPDAAAAAAAAVPSASSITTRASGACEVEGTCNSNPIDPAAGDPTG